MASPFIFKHFRLNQSESAFKLGTDSVLLGAWLPAKNYSKILDVGGGTGILSLMMAQRFQEALIFSIEIDKNSADEKANNFTQSKWKDRLSSIQDNVLDWSKNNSEKFDLIITNPPYFTNDLQNTDPRKANTRHTADLNANTISSLIRNHLSSSGDFACILPSQEFDQWTNTFESNEIFLNQICLIRSFADSDVIRMMGVFSFHKKERMTEDRFIYNRDKSRSEWYALITAEFYIR